MAITILFILGYLVSGPWILVTQVVTLGRLAPERSLDARVQVVVLGEILAVFFGGLGANLLLGIVVHLLGAAGVSPFTAWARSDIDLSSPGVAGAVMLTWIAVWWLLASALKATLMKWRWGLPVRPWGLALRLSARAYVGTAIALVPFLLFP